MRRKVQSEGMGAEEELAREGDGEAAGGGCTCDFCGAAPAVVYCRADAARLCLACDRHVHAANSVCSRHPRALLCDACRAAPAAFLCSGPPNRSLLLCSNCDFDAHPDGLHDRRSVEPFSGCPSAVELPSILGIDGDEKSVASGIDEGWREGGGSGWPFADGEWVWETGAVLSMEDLIVPTTSFHGFQAMMNFPHLPKNQNQNQNLTCGKQKEEILRQLRELIKSENQVNGDCGEPDPAMEFKPLVHQQGLQKGNLNSDVDQEAACIVVPSYEGNTVQWNHSDCHESADTVTFSYEQLIGNSPMVKSSFPDGTTDVHSSARYANDNGRDQGPSVTNEMISSLPPRGGVELCPDRDSVISRYKEKREKRRYDKHIRYESRKARADSRVRVKGRFAKGNGRTGT